MSLTKDKCIICGKEIPTVRLEQGKKTCCRHCQMLTPESKQKRSNIMKNIQNKPETKEKLSIAMRAKWADTTYRNNCLAGMIKAQNKPEVKAKISEANKAYHASEKHQEFIKAMNKPETKVKMSKSQKARFANEVKHQEFIKAMNKPETIEKLRLKMLSYEVQEKINFTKKANGSFNTSKDEDRAYELLSTIFPDTQRQYYCNKYPFKCDFYIPLIDLFIEAHFGWRHGGRDFDEQDKDCLALLETWKNKAGDSLNYANAIYQWTDLDVRKKRWANNHPELNILFFFSFKEFEQWLNNIQ